MDEENSKANFHHTTHAEEAEAEIHQTVGVMDNYYPTNVADDDDYAPWNKAGNVASKMADDHLPKYLKYFAQDFAQNSNRNSLQTSDKTIVELDALEQLKTAD